MLNVNFPRTFLRVTVQVVNCEFSVAICMYICILLEAQHNGLMNRSHFFTEPDLLMVTMTIGGREVNETGIKYIITLGRR